MNCLICKSKTKRFGKLDNYIIYKCNNCGFGLTDGVKLQTGDYHRDETYDQEEKLFKNIFQKRAKIINKLSKPGKVLEIGCSTGILLSLLKSNGWDVRGVELSSKAAKIAKSKDIPVTIAPFEKIDFKEKFDLVILNHTLEHLQDPHGVILKIKKILKPKGLVYIDVPNFGGLTAKILRKKWPLLLPQEHLWHFSEKSLRLLLKDFKVIFVNKSSGIWDYGHPFKGLMESLFGMKKRFFREILTAKSSWVISKLGKGADLMIIARKR